MNIQDLIERLQEVAEIYPDAEVQMAVQPNYPIAEIISGVASPDDELDAAEDMGDEEIERISSAPAKVWLVSGGQDNDSPYAPRWVFGAVS